MAFWGCQLKPGDKQEVESKDGEVLHLSQACLHSPQPGKTVLQVQDGKDIFALAMLAKGKVEYASFDLFFKAGQCTFINKGTSELHLTGYFEPKAEDMEDEEEEEEEEEP